MAAILQDLARKKTARIIVLTGARQTGKTTLCKKLFKDYAFVSLEDPVLRVSYRNLTATQWSRQFPLAILDEIQKEPKLVESIKAVWDQYEEPRYVITGSSQILLLEKVRESLAGRCSIVELFPLTLVEMQSDSFDSPLSQSPFMRILTHNAVEELVDTSLLLDRQYPEKAGIWSHYLRFGGYPALIDAALDDDERQDWLKNYVRTYLERDIRDIASFRDLEPFIKLQHYLARQTASLVNYQSMATHLGINAKTVQRYLRFFELSYQLVLLPSWERNPNKRLVKAPKIHWLDNGVLRAVLQQWDSCSGNQFESLVIAEMYKQVQSQRLDARFHHLRTADGREVDLLVELPDGYYAFEIKMADHVAPSDARHLRKLGDILDKPLLHAFIVSNDSENRHLEEGISAINVLSLLCPL